MIPHGTHSGYTSHACRCDACLTASRRAIKKWRLRVIENGGPLLIDSTGTLRRIRALQAIGWPPRLIAKRAGVNDTALRTFIYKPYPTVTVDRATKIAAAFEALCMTPGPSKRSATAARKRGFAPPLAWDDIDNPAATPQGVSL